MNMLRPVFLRQQISVEQTYYWGPQGVSVRASCSAWSRPISVAWLNTPSSDGRGWQKTRYFTFGEGVRYYHPEMDEPLSAVLERWADSFRDEPFAEPFAENASSKGVNAWSVEYELAVEHIDRLSDRLSSVLRELSEL